MHHCGSLWDVDLEHTVALSSEPLIIHDLSRAYDLPPGVYEHSFTGSSSCKEGSLLVYLDEIQAWDCYESETVVTLGDHFRSPCRCFSEQQPTPLLEDVLMGAILSLLVVPLAIGIGRCLGGAARRARWLGSERDWLLRGAALRLLDKATDVLVLMYLASHPALWVYCVLSLIMFGICAFATCVFVSNDSPFEPKVGDRVRIKKSGRLALIIKREVDLSGEVALSLVDSDDSPRGAKGAVAESSQKGKRAGRNAMTLPKSPHKPTGKKAMVVTPEDIQGLQHARMAQGTVSIFAAPLGLASVLEATRILRRSTPSADADEAHRSLGVQRAVQAVLDSAPQLYIQLAALLVEGPRHAKTIGPLGQVLLCASIVISFSSLLFGLTYFLCSPTMEKAACRVRDEYCREVVVIVGVAAHLAFDIILRAVAVCTVVAALSKRAILTDSVLILIVWVFTLPKVRLAIHNFFESANSALYADWDASNVLALSMCFATFLGQTRAREKRLRTTGKLTVFLDRAFELQAADFGGKSDPYVVLHLGDQVHKSSTIMKTVDPAYNETFEFRGVLSDFVLDPHGLILEVYDKDVLSGDDVIGVTSVSLRDALMKKRGPLPDDYVNSKHFHRPLKLWRWWAHGPLRCLGQYIQGNIIFAVSWKPDAEQPRQKVFKQLDEDRALEGMIKQLQVPPFWKRYFRWLLDAILRALMTSMAPSVLQQDAFSASKLEFDMLYPTVACLAAVVVPLAPWLGFPGWVPHYHLDAWSVELAITLSTWAALAKVFTFFWCFLPAITGSSRVLGIPSAATDDQDAKPLVTGIVSSSAMEEGVAHMDDHDGDQYINDKHLKYEADQNSRKHIDSYGHPGYSVGGIAAEYEYDEVEEEEIDAEYEHNEGEGDYAEGEEAQDEGEEAFEEEEYEEHWEGRQEDHEVDEEGEYSDVDQNSDIEPSNRQGRDEEYHSDLSDSGSERQLPKAHPIPRSRFDA